MTSQLKVIFAAALLAAVVGTGAAIQCYQCKSNENLDCSEIFDQLDSNTYPKSCDNIFEARYCVKATGMYEGEIGTKRFCSSRDHGNYCEYIRRPGDDREYRSCVYTCSRDGCNDTASVCPDCWIVGIALLYHWYKTTY
uniref:U20-Liphistoxin-Lsp1a_1 n=1 Tax=Liphistius sp. SGP-2016 TaxID=1905180 RepID=A0A4Q8K274_9ARAC